MAAHCAKIIELQIYFVPPTIYSRLSLSEQCSPLLKHSFSIILVSEPILSIIALYSVNAKGESGSPFNLLSDFMHPDIILRPGK